jgi:hypothetical protein
MQNKANPIPIFVNLMNSVSCLDATLMITAHLLHSAAHRCNERGVPAASYALLLLLFN